MTRADNFAKKTIVVTGGAGGIGGGVVRALRARGATVAVLDIAQSSDATLSITCDVTEACDVAAGMRRVRSEFGDPELLVCAAGVVKEFPFEDLEQEEWQRVIDVSLTSVYLITREMLPGMVRRGGGAVVTMSSGWGRKGYPFGSNYAAAKSGVEALSKSLALEYALRGVRVNSVAPGPVKTAMIQDNPAFDEHKKAAAVPMGRLGEIDDVVAPILFLLSEESAYITGQVLHVNGGLLMP